MFDEMIERIQRTTIAVLLKVKVEFRQAPPPRRQMPEQSAPAAPVRRPLRRQMPEPLTNMSSYKEAAAKRAELLRAANGGTSEPSETQENETK